MTAPKTFRLGPGSLTFGETASLVEFSQQVLECEVSFGVDSTDDTDVLSGDIVAGEDTFTAELKFEAYQDLTAAGINTWSLTNRGVIMPFTFIPSVAEGRELTGVVKIRPLTIGGKTKDKPTASVEFPCVGIPTLGNVTP